MKVLGRKSKKLSVNKKLELKAKLKSISNLKKKRKAVVVRDFKFVLECNKKYSHTATSRYIIQNAQFLPDFVRRPSCHCDTLIKETQPKVFVTIERDLKETIFCTLDSNTKSSDIYIKVDPGKQIAFKCVGDIPVILSGKIATEKKVVHDQIVNINENSEGDEDSEGDSNNGIDSVSSETIESCSNDDTENESRDCDVNMKDDEEDESDDDDEGESGDGNEY